MPNKLHTPTDPVAAKKYKDKRKKNTEAVARFTAKLKNGCEEAEKIKHECERMKAYVEELEQQLAQANNKIHSLNAYLINHDCKSPPAFRQQLFDTFCQSNAVIGHGLGYQQSAHYGSGPSHDTTTQPQMNDQNTNVGMHDNYCGKYQQMPPTGFSSQRHHQPHINTNVVMPSVPAHQPTAQLRHHPYHPLAYQQNSARTHFPSQNPHHSHKAHQRPSAFWVDNFEPRNDPIVPENSSQTSNLSPPNGQRRKTLSPTQKLNTPYAQYFLANQEKDQSDGALRELPKEVLDENLPYILE